PIVKRTGRAILIGDILGTGGAGINQVDEAAMVGAAGHFAVHVLNLGRGSADGAAAGLLFGRELTPAVERIFDLIVEIGSAAVGSRFATGEAEGPAAAVVSGLKT